MSVPFDIDMLSFLLSNLKVLFGSKVQLRKNSRPIPMKYDFEEIPPEGLSAAQNSFLQSIDKQLAEINYFPLCTFRARNYGTNLLRRYRNPLDTASCALTVIEVRTTVGGTTTVKQSASLEFATRFSDGRLLITQNAELKSLMDQPPYRIRQSVPNAASFAELKRKHDARAGELGVPVAPPQDAEGVFRELQEEHERFSNYQVQQGVLQIAAEGNFYVLTDKVFNRGILNFLLPFGNRISFSRVVFTALVGALLPLAGILQLSPLLAAQNPGGAAAGMGLPSLALLGCYALAGAVIGYAGDGPRFNWVFLVTYLPAHLVAGWSFGIFPYSTVAALASHFTGQSRRRRRMILQT